MKFLIRSIFSFLLFIAIGWPQTTYAQTGTTEGREFYMGFLINGSSNNPFNLTVYISGKKATTGTLTVIGQDYTVPFTITPNSTRTIAIPTSFKPQLAGEKEAIAIRVIANQEVSVYAFNETDDTGDASIVLPIQSLSDNYLIHAYNNDFFQESFTQNQVLLVGTQDTTIYDFTTTADIFDLQENLLFSRGTVIRDTLLLGEQIAYHALDNLSGSTVQTINNDPDEDCLPIAVFIGHMATNVDVCQSPDHLFHQLYAPADWGYEYMVIPFATRFGGDVVQIMAEENNTIVNIGSNQSVTLNRGERHTFIAPIVTPIQASRRISVMHLSRGKRCDDTERGDNIADPFMIMLSPANQIIKELTFDVIRNEETERYFLNMVVPANDIEVTYNGTDISDQFQVSNQNPNYAYLNYQVTPGTRRLYSKNGVVAHLYAFGESESYGMGLGANLGEFEVEIFDEQFGQLFGEQVNVCEASTITFNVTSEIDILKDTYRDFQWVLSTGEVLDGDRVTFDFDTAGVYTLDMIASKEASSCSQIIVTRTVNVIEDALDDIDGPASVCPTAQDIVYEVAGAENGYTYQWLINGGTFDGASQGRRVQVDWSISDPNASISVFSRSPQGCLSDTVKFDIVLNEVLQPSAPQGPAQLCIDNITSVFYRTPLASGSSYQWEAIGGTVVGGQGTNQVEVQWDGPGTHTLRFYESTSVNTLCGGVSEDLEVIVYNALQASEDMTRTSCNGDSDGTLSLDINGGLGPYSVSWSNGMSGTSIQNLAAGDYVATIRDQLGCEIQRTFQVEEPGLLQIAAIVQNAVCNGARGFATIQINGGTGPFSLNWRDGFSSSNARRDGLGKGSYGVEVVDANGCKASLDFLVEEPAALVASFEERPACPEAADGILEVIVDGGTLPYTYVWEADVQNDNSVLSNVSAGNYSLTVIDGAGCELSLNSTVTNLTPLIEMPSAFSPNGDGLNDVFEAVYNCGLSFQLYVYNKWGQIVFQSNDINEGWDGTYNGSPVDTGTYTYQLKYQTVFNGTELTEIQEGRVQLIR